MDGYRTHDLVGVEIGEILKRVGRAEGHDVRHEKSTGVYVLHNSEDGCRYTKQQRKLYSFVSGELGEYVSPGRHYDHDLPSKTKRKD